MPMTWNAAADAKLFAAIMKVYDVKISSSKLETVALMMGDDCTAKAITHRLAKIRQYADEPTEEGGAVKDPGTPKTTAAKRKRNTTKKNNEEDEEAEEDVKINKKIKKESAAEDDEEKEIEEE